MDEEEREMGEYLQENESVVDNNNDNNNYGNGNSNNSNSNGINNINISSNSLVMQEVMQGRSPSQSNFGPKVIIIILYNLDNWKNFNYL